MNNEHTQTAHRVPWYVSKLAVTAYPYADRSIDVVGVGLLMGPRAVTARTPHLTVVATWTPKLWCSQTVQSSQHI